MEMWYALGSDWRKKAREWWKQQYPNKAKEAEEYEND